jgi:hypothetical protein
MAAKISSCANATSPCFASSRPAIKVLLQAARVFSMGSAEITAIAETFGRSRSSDSPSAVSAKRFKIRAGASGIE